MKFLIPFILLSFGTHCCEDDSLSLVQFEEQFLKIVTVDSVVEFESERIKLINTFHFYKRFFPPNVKEKFQKQITYFENNLWDIVKDKFDFVLSAGGGYYSSILNVHYGGSLSTKNYYSIIEYHDFVNDIKKEYELELD